MIFTVVANSKIKLNYKKIVKESEYPILIILEHLLKK